MLLEKHMLKKGITEKKFRSMNTLDIAMLLAEADAQLLFWCQARDCGESSLWANEVFGNAKLNSMRTPMRRNNGSQA
ncbi:DUF4892 domain-containing protein, partial [Klebsiella pneumoniae]|uniref:DUF4892 domain-containing protein n=1 Tax=Klebsiella pneumoniae TaxID=573 RepID=UPI002730B6CD